MKYDVIYDSLEVLSDAYEVLSLHYDVIKENIKREHLLKTTDYDYDIAIESFNSVMKNIKKFISLWKRENCKLYGIVWK